MQTDVYLTLQDTSTATYVDRRSRFLAFAHHVEAEADVHRLLTDYRRQYHDARHVCYAYVLSPDGSVVASSDNGEPSGTAGRPIQEQIRACGLTNVLVVVVRYFGGIKLGTPALRQAYKQVAHDALVAAGVQEQTVQEQFTLSFDYPMLDRVLRLIREAQATVTHKDFGMTCKLTLNVRQSEAATLRARLSKLINLNIS